MKPQGQVHEDDGIGPIKPLFNGLPRTEAIDDPGTPSEQRLMRRFELVRGEGIPTGQPLDEIKRNIG